MLFCELCIGQKSLFFEKKVEEMHKKCVFPLSFFVVLH